MGDLLADGLGAAFEGGFLGAALDAWAGEGPGVRCWCLHRRVVVGVGVVMRFGMILCLCEKGFL